MVQNCHGRFFDVTGIFAKIVTGTKKNVTGKKKTLPPPQQKKNRGIAMCTKVMSHKSCHTTLSVRVYPWIEMLHRIKPRRLLGKVNEMMAAHKNAVVIANMRQKNQLIVVPTPFR